MKTSFKFLALGLFFTTSVMLQAQHVYSNPYSEAESMEAVEKTTSEKLIKEVDKIIKLSEELATADGKREQVIKRKIAAGQERILELRDKLNAEATTANYTTFSKHNFDVADKSLNMSDFEVARNGDTRDFNISFETKSVGKARIDIVSPGGELLKSVFISDYNGRARKRIDLTSEKGQVYFIHIDVDGKAITKKVRFS